MPLLEITRIVWLEDIVEKLLWKHGVEEWEVIEVMESRPKFIFKESGHRLGEDVYAAFGRTIAERLFRLHPRWTCDRRFSAGHE